MSSSSSSRCAGCRYLRRKCPSTCILSPYFPPNDPQRFLYVHKVYGASNVSKMLQQVPVQQRAEAADSLYYEAYCRLNDPVYGCVGIITILQQQIYNTQREIAKTEAEVAVLSNQAQTSSTNYYEQQQQKQQSESHFGAAGSSSFDQGEINDVVLAPFDPSFQPHFPWN